jgi:hypothetical protein
MVDPSNGRANLHWYNWFRGLEQLFRDPDVPVVAPADAAYLVAALSGGLVQERVLTAGTGITLVDGGANNPLTISAVASSAVLQVLQNTYVINANLANVIPLGDNVPLITAGDQVLSQVITLASASNKVMVTTVLRGAQAAANGNLTFAVFRGSVCIDAGGNSFTSANFPAHLMSSVLDTPGTVGPHTYTVRVGPGAAGTVRLNGSAVGRHYGGASVCTLTVSEIKG